MPSADSLPGARSLWHRRQAGESNGGVHRIGMSGRSNTARPRGSSTRGAEAQAVTRCRVDVARGIGTCSPLGGMQAFVAAVRGKSACISGTPGREPQGKPRTPTGKPQTRAHRAKGGAEQARMNAARGPFQGTAKHAGTAPAGARRSHHSLRQQTLQQRRHSEAATVGSRNNPLALHRQTRPSLGPVHRRDMAREAKECASETGQRTGHGSDRALV